MKSFLPPKRANKLESSLTPSWQHSSSLKTNNSKTKNEKELAIAHRERPEIVHASSQLVSTNRHDSQTNNWSSSLQTVLDRPPAKLPQRLILSGVLSCCVLLAWAWWGQVEDIGTAQGQLVPQGETYKIEPISSGKVGEIKVREGEKVHQGQVLIELDPEIAAQEVQRLEQMLSSYEEELEQQKALLEKSRLESIANRQISTAEIASQQSAIAANRESIAVIRQLLQQQQKESDAYHAKQQDLKPLSGWATQRLEQLDTEKLAHQERLQRLQNLQQQGAISQELIFEAEEKLRQIEQQITQVKMQEVTSAQEQLFQVEQSIRELEANTVQQQGELAAALKEEEQLAVELRQKQAESDRSNFADRQKIQQLELEIAQMQTKIADTKNQLITAQAKLRQNWLTAPVDGTVLSLNVSNTGKVVNAGETVVEIAPQNQPLVLSAMLPNKEAGFVELGMPVQVKLDAYAYQDYGFVSGKVIEISSDAETHEQWGEAYQIKVSLDQDRIVDGQKTIKFKPGQTATADIVIRRRRLLSIFLDPIQKIRHDGIDL